MLYNLNTFYHSKYWLKLVRILRQERVNDDGYVLCTYCGKPIVKAYDIIGHHKIHLTEENVNDANISLNPDNVELVHHRCHNYIHEKLGYSRREVYLVYGPPMAGKSSYVESVKESGDLVVDLDKIRECVSGEHGHVLVPKLNQIVFGIRGYLLDAVRVRLGRWDHAYIVGTYPICSERERICKETGAQEIYIECSMEECLRRLKEDPDNRDMDKWTGFIEDWFSKYIPPTA